jgi:TorA-specific chaperone
LSENDEAGTAAKKLETFLSECNGLTDDEIDERLNISYTAIFYLNMPVFTSESAWLSPEGLIMQEQWEQVMRIYEIYGFKKPESYAEPEDHIGLEFLFMASLSNSVAKLLQQKPPENTKQTERLMACKKHFLEVHLGKWAKGFANGVLKKSADTMSLYAGAALLGAAMVEFEKKDM